MDARRPEKRTKPRPTNGWREGRDPVQRWLRIVTAVVCLGVFAFLAVDPTRGVNDWPTIALALGSCLVLLGYEGVVRLPYFDRAERPSWPATVDPEQDPARQYQSSSWQPPAWQSPPYGVSPEYPDAEPGASADNPPLPEDFP